MDDNLEYAVSKDAHEVVELLYEIISGSRDEYDFDNDGMFTNLTKAKGGDLPPPNKTIVVPAVYKIPKTVREKYRSMGVRLVRKNG